MIHTDRPGRRHGDGGRHPNMDRLVGEAQQKVDIGGVIDPWARDGACTSALSHRAGPLREMFPSGARIAIGLSGPWTFFSITPPLHAAWCDSGARVEVPMAGQQRVHVCQL